MDNLKKAQELNRATMRKLHEVCKKYNIKYFYDSGSLIGAVRHKSFVPWDDDIDVAFTREEYNKFMNIPKEEWGPDFEVLTCKQLVHGAFLDCVSRLLNMTEDIDIKSYDKALDNIDEKYRKKLGIDLFIIDSAYDNSFRQKMHVLHLIMIYGKAMGHRKKIDYSEYGTAQKVVIGGLSKIGRHKDLNKILDKYDKVSQSANNKNTKKCFYSNYPMSYLGLVLEKSWFKSTVPLQVDDDYFDAPVEYDKVLRCAYGDYMQLPPEEKRKPDHVRI